MQIRMIFNADVGDTEDMRGLCEQIGMCFEELGDARLISVSQVKGSAPVKYGRGPYRNVMLSDIGLKELEERFGAARAESLIADLSYKLYQKNYRYSDHFAVIVEWSKQQALSNTEGGSRAASFDVDEFFAAAVKKGVGE